MIFKELEESLNILDPLSYWREFPERDVEFVRWYPVKVNALSEEDIWKRRESGFYFHIPFCNNVCLSCPYNKFDTRSSLARQYLDALKQEIKNYASRPYIQDSEFISGYFGGGTPTSLTTKQMHELITVMFNNLNIRKGATITIETTPVDIDEEKAAMLLENGIDRISIGVQSFNEALLKHIGRTYTPGKVKETISILRKVGYKQICMDLMYGLPGQTLKHWEDTLDEFLSLRLESVSLYIYLVLPPSSLYLKIRKGLVPPPANKEVQNEMYNLAVDKILSAGYLAVTTNDFGGDVTGDRWGDMGARIYDLGPEGFKGLVASTFPLTAHLNHTWYECGDLLALGSGAYGYIKDHVYLNEPDINKYIARLNDGKLPAVMGTYVSTREKMARALVLGIKLLKISRQDFEDKFGIDIMQIYGDKIEQLKEWGLVKLNDDSLEVTFPKGWQYIDNISKAFFTVENYRLPQPAPTNTEILKYLKQDKKENKGGK